MVVASILIHLDFLSILYCEDIEDYMHCELQSLFTWIFYLFQLILQVLLNEQVRFNPYSPGFSIYFLGLEIPSKWKKHCFNPYSPGFSIYFDNNYSVAYNLGCFNPYSPGFSIYLLKKL